MSQDCLSDQLPSRGRAIAIGGTDKYRLGGPFVSKGPGAGSTLMDAMGLSSRAAFVLTLVVGVVGTGLVVAGVSMTGYSTLASAIWVLGYGGMVIVLWYRWLRPLEFDPGGADEGSGDESDRPTRDS